MVDREPIEQKAVDALLARLLARPREFSFYQALQILAAVTPDRTEIGSIDHAREIAVVRSWPSLVRSGSDVRTLQATPHDDVGPPYELEVAFMGLYGLSSPTPAYFWDYVQRHPESPLRDFLDIFNSRWIGLFYQAWKRYRWPLVYRGGLQDPMTRRVFCLLGMGTERDISGEWSERDSMEQPHAILAEHEQLDPFPNRLRLLGLAGPLSARTRPPYYLEAMLAEYFSEDLPPSSSIWVEENVFQWAYLHPSDTNRLGQANSRTGGAFAFVAGTRIPDRMGAFRIHLGPLPWERFIRFFPNQDRFTTLSRLVRLGSPFGLEFDLDLLLEPQEVPPWKLGTEVPGEGLLGWSTWAHSSPRANEPGKVLLRPLSAG